MRWLRRMWRRPKTDAGREARQHQERVQAQQPEVDNLLGRLSDRVDRNHFRRDVQAALNARRH